MNSINSTVSLTLDAKLEKESYCFFFFVSKQSSQTIFFFSFLFVLIFIAICRHEHCQLIVLLFSMLAVVCDSTFFGVFPMLQITFVMSMLKILAKKLKVPYFHETV